jgi:hypothetical protein
LGAKKAILMVFFIIVHKPYQLTQSINLSIVILLGYINSRLNSIRIIAKSLNELVQEIRSKLVAEKFHALDA